jgi:SAM-dependent methyltransferase
MLRMEYFVKNHIPAPEGGGQVRVLDVGSYDVNGNYRRLFDGERFSYTGLDVSEGPNVDIVPKSVYRWAEIESGSFDVVISGQAMEHIEFFWVTAAEMARVLRPGGLMCLIMPRGFPLHRYPVDCYRFDADGMVAIARFCNLTPLHASTDMRPEGAPRKGWHKYRLEDSMLIASKPEGWSGTVDAGSYEYRPADMTALTVGFVPGAVSWRRLARRLFERAAWYL